MADESNDRKDRKDRQLVIRIKKAERDTFVELCETLDTSAAREIRRFIREFTRSHALAVGLGHETDTPSDNEPARKHGKKIKRAKKK